MAEGRGAEVVVVGNAGVDTNVYLPGDAIDETLEGAFTDTVDYVGQAGGYSARGFAQLGRRTAFVGALGDDPAGAMVRAALARDGVDTSAVFTDPAGTARSVNLVFRDGRRRNFYDGRGHREVRPDLEAARRVLAGARLVLFHLPDWARLLLPTARADVAVVACDLQDAVDLDDPYRADFVAAADILFVSAANLADPADAVRRLAEGRRAAVCGLGAEGVLVAAGGAVRHVPPPPVDLPVVDTNGAGDGLAVGFLDAFVLDGTSVGEAVLRGQLVARWTCAQRGSTDTLVSRARLEELRAAGG